MDEEAIDDLGYLPDEIELDDDSYDEDAYGDDEGDAYDFNPPYDLGDDPDYVPGDYFDDRMEAAMERAMDRYAPEYEEPYFEPDMPSPYSDPTGYAQFLEESVTGRVVETIANLAQQRQAQAQMLDALGGEQNAMFIAQQGFTPNDMAYIASDPRRASMFRRMAEMDGPSRTSAPRSEGGYVPDNGYLAGDVQREIDRAFPAYHDAFGVSKAQFTKMVLNKHGQAY